MTDQFESVLRDALAKQAAEVPLDARARLHHANYHPRSRRLEAALTVGGVAGVAGTAAAVVSIVGFGAQPQAAFAGWSASPTIPAEGQVEAAEAACLARVPSSADAERAEADGTAQAPVMKSLLKIAPSEWRATLTDTRGTSTMVILLAAKGQAQASCLSSASSTVVSAGPVGGEATAVPAGQVSTLSFGNQRLANGQPFSYAQGRLGTGVSGVTLVLEDGTHVATTIANGLFLAWWPGSQRAVAEEAATATGTSTHQLDMPS